jgi:hypothetical protein
VLIGLALISGFFLMPAAAYNWLFWIGIVPLVSGLVGFCPGYKALGYTTNRDDGGGTASA